MKKSIPGRLGPLVLALVLIACASVPITGRKQLSLIPESQMMAMSYTEYDTLLKSNKLSTDKSSTDMVKRVGLKIQKGVETYFSQQNLSDQLEGYQWEFNLIDSKDINAWCMPGGKVVVYTGILPVTKDETGLAVVMGHEIAHAIARHGSERMSEQLLQQLGAVALDAALQKKSEETRALWSQVYGVGSQVGVVLPHSRTQESEADHLGLVFMAIAGYNPALAVPFWQRMSQQSSGGKPPEFLSTHPSDETRISQIRQLLPEALKYYTKK